MKALAFKEWDCVVRALGSGEQPLILRKGGIHEPGRFKVQKTRFLLFPTFEHQAQQDLNESGRKKLEVSLHDRVSAGKIRLEYEAVLERAWWVDDPGVLSRLSVFHTASEAGLKKKFEWGDRPGLTVLLVRVFKLEEALEIPDLPAYGGCRSWLELDLDESIPASLKSRPVISETDFAKVSDAVKGLLSNCEDVTQGALM